MKNTLKIAVCAAALSLTTAVQAVSISGEVAFSGKYTQNGGTLGQLNTATSFSISSVAIDDAFGDFAGATAPLSFASPIGVNGNAPTLVGATLWSITVGPKTYTFKVGSFTETYNPGSGTSDQINITGLGIASDGIGGLDDTTGSFELNFGNSGTSTFTWRSSSAVPDGGATAMLIGVGLLGLGALRRKA